MTTRHSSRIKQLVATVASTAIALSSSKPKDCSVPLKSLCRSVEQQYMGKYKFIIGIDEAGIIHCPTAFLFNNLVKEY
jgi:hypothetical protein